MRTVAIISPPDLLDWDGAGGPRTQEVEIRDASDGTMLDTRAVTGNPGLGPAAAPHVTCHPPTRAATAGSTSLAPGSVRAR